MGHKVNPIIFRIGVIRQANAKWFAKKNYAQYLQEDIKIREFLKKKLKEARVARIEIERSVQTILLIIYTSRPGVIIGRGGAGIENLKREIKRKFLASRKVNLNLSIQEVEKPDLDAELVLQNMIEQVEKRVPFRRVMKRGIESVMRAGVQGIKIIMSGRLNGVEIARTECLSAGKIPLHTIRADIDYARGTARTTYGAIGIKVWIYKGLVFNKEEKNRDKS